jgi:hypothetical protein
MSVAIAIGFVMTAIQFLKKIIPSLAGTAATIAVIVLSAGVTGYKFINEALSIGLPVIVFFVEVVVGALGAYSLVKVAGGNER